MIDAWITLFSSVFVLLERLQHLVSLKKEKNYLSPLFHIHFSPDYVTNPNHPILKIKIMYDGVRPISHVNLQGRDIGSFIRGEEKELEYEIDDYPDAFDLFNEKIRISCLLDGGHVYREEKYILGRKLYRKQ